MAKITYEDKVKLNDNVDIPRVNKVTDEDLNEIKKVINENDNNVGDLSNLNTDVKDSLVNAINEVKNGFITAYLTTKTIINNTAQKINFDNSYVVGNKLKFQDGSIIVNNDNVKYVEVSASVSGQAPSDLNNLQLLCMIYKNNEQINTGYDFKPTLKTYYFANAIISKFLVPVKKGDSISLYTQVSDNQTLQIVNEFKYGTAYLTVETI